jgi:hypothetical protein
MSVLGPLHNCLILHNLDHVVAEVLWQQDQGDGLSSKVALARLICHSLLVLLYPRVHQPAETWGV